IHKVWKRVFTVTYDGGYLRFSGGLAPVMTRSSSMISFSNGGDVYRATGEQFGYIDTSGQEVIGVQFDGAGLFSDGLAPVALGQFQGVVSPDKWGFIDKNGMLGIKPRFSEVHSFSEGLAAVHTGSWKNIGKPYRSWVSGKWGYIDKLGKPVIAAQFDGADPFSQGMAAVLIGNKWGYIDKTGKIVIKPQFVGNRAFGDGLAPVLVHVEPEPEAQETPIQ